MIISEIGIRGYKSFGNNETNLKLNTEKGELILLMGKNGEGKSSFLETFEYTLYGKVRSKSKKYHKLSSLPNRINGELLNKIKFYSSNTDIIVERGIKPNILNLTENGTLNERAGKANLDDIIENYVGMDIDTFKSFISMSVDSFKNFMSLSNDEKKMLLDKLFNLEVINILNNILKEVNKANKSKLLILDTEIRTIEESIDSIQKSIDKANEREKENIQIEIDALILETKSKKDEYTNLKLKVDTIKEKTQQLVSELDSEKRQYNNTLNDIKNVQKEIDLYDMGKCPTCSTDFTSEHFDSLRGLLVDKKNGFDKILKEIELNINNIKEKQVKLNKISDSATNSFSEIIFLLKGYKSKIDILNNKKNVDSINIQEFSNTILELDDKKNVSIEKTSEAKEKELYYKELNKLFGEDGVRKSIITSIIKPINHFISDNINALGLNFDVKLDETFSAEIKTLGSIVDHDTLSTGEMKMVNISILIAYLKLIRTKKHINILFLDEVFSSIDVDNIYKILGLLKTFAVEYKINIFVVHHAILNEDSFDKIIKIEKNIFTVLTEIKND